MSDRPTGDAVDLEFRRLMSDISTVPGPTPELDELHSPVLTLEGEQTMPRTVKYGLIAAAAAAVVIVVSLALFVGGDDQGLETIDVPEEPTTTTTAGSTTTATADGTTTTAPATTLETTIAESSAAAVDPATFVDWQDYESSTSRTIAANCAASFFFQRIGWSVGIQEFSFPLSTDPDFEYLLDVSTVREWLPDFEAWVRLRRSLIGEFDVESLAILDGLTSEIEAVRAAVDTDGDGEVDLGAMMVEWWYPYQQATADPSCALGVTSRGNRRIDDAMNNFSSDSEAFGGRGTDAANRCVSTTAFRLILDDILDRGSEQPLASRGDDALVLVEAFWEDRPIDQAVVDLAAQWRAIEFNEGLATTEQLDEVRGVLDDLLAYRASMPEGDILCPLDDGWEA